MLHTGEVRVEASALQALRSRNGVSVVDTVPCVVLSFVCGHYNFCGLVICGLVG